MSHFLTIALFQWRTSGVSAHTARAADRAGCIYGHPPSVGAENVTRPPSISDDVVCKSMQLLPLE